MNKITLTKPIEAHGKTITELELREPSTGDIIDFGKITETGFDKKGSVVLRSNTSVVADYISRLGNIPPSVVRSLHPADFLACEEMLTDFLVTAQKTS